MGPRSNANTVNEYQSSRATRGQTATLTLDEKILASILQNDIKRPQGYTVSFHANPEIEKHHFGMTHPMKPWRLTLCNKIVFSYGMHRAMDLYLTRNATQQELELFHTEDYIRALQK